MLNWLRGRKAKNDSQSLEALAFATGLESGIEMVRLAAARVKQGHQVSFEDVADIMQQVLDEFREEHCSD